MGNNYRFRDVHGGAGGVNIGDGNRAAGRDYQDNRSWHTTVQSLDEDLERLTTALDGLRLSASERQQAALALHGAKGAAASGDQAEVGGHVRRFTEVLRDAGALAGAGATLIDALTRIGRWLGPVGAAVLALL